MFRYRQSDLDRLNALLAAGERLVTVIGPGGSGKTTLARQLEVAHFVDLTACRTAADATGALERAVGSDLSAVEGVVVLDNCEQIPDLAPAVKAWRAAGPAVFVATSRTPLQLRDEHRLRLERLSDPDAADLFLRRAAQHGVDDIAPDAAAAIVAHLDGLPLAVELCASRVASLGTDGILARLDRPLSMLSDRKADRPERQSSLERTLRWSWELLSTEAQRAFAQVALFAGRFTLDDCDWVVLDGVWVGDALEELVEASLLEPGFQLLEGPRAFALQHVDLDDRRRFWAWLMESPASRDRIEEAVLAFRSAAEHAAEVAVRLALWADPVLTRGAPIPLRVEVLTAAHAIDPAEPYLRMRLAHAKMTEGAIDAAVPLFAGLDTHPDPSVAATAVAGMARLASNQHDLRRARDLWRRAREMYAALGDEEAVGRALSQKANFDKTLGDLDDARASMQEALALARKSGSLGQTGLTLAHLGTLTHDLGDLDAAERYMAEAQSIFETLQHDLRVGDLHATRGIILLEQGDLDGAMAGIQRAIAVHEEHAAPRWVNWYRMVEAVILFLRGDTDEARTRVVPLVTALRRYTLVGTSEIGVLYGCCIVEDAALRQVWLDEVLERTHDVPFAPILFWAHELAAAVGDAPRLREVCARLSEPQDGFPPAFDWSSEIRLLGLLSKHATGTTDFTYGDGWFETPDGTRVDLRTRAALRRILAALVAARGERGLSMDDVFAAGWPGQSIHPDAMGNRVYTSIAALRKMGLDPVLVRHDDGYRLVAPGDS